MDIEKERELFLAHMRSIGSAGFMFELDEDGNFDDMSMAYAWSAWQAAKAQAVPEGFILVRKEPDADLVNHGHQVFLGHFNEGGQTGGRSLYFAYKAMIEAQEPTND